jgi:hypothetical protein
MQITSQAKPREEQSQTILSIPATGTLVGATVSIIVYSALSTTGTLVSEVASGGIRVAGAVLGYGTELVAGTVAGNTVREIANSYSIVARPAISNVSHMGAIGVSVVAGAGAALATSAVINTGSYIGSKATELYKDYKGNLAKKLQYPVPLTNIEDDVVVVQDEYEDLPIPI